MHFLVRLILHTRKWLKSSAQAVDLGRSGYVIVV